MISIALLDPKIPQNTGNIARLAVGLDIELFLVGKLGFSLNDKYLKRAGLDYWPFLKLKVYTSLEEFTTLHANRRLVLATTKGKISYYDYRYRNDDIILFGAETKGLPEKMIRDNIENSITIPMPGEVRSINLANSVAVISYHALYSTGYFKDFATNKNYYKLF